MSSWTSTLTCSWRLRRVGRRARRARIEEICPRRSDTMVPEGLRPHSAIGAASGVAAPLEGRPAKDFSNWSCDTLDSSSACDRGPRKSGGFFRAWQQCRHAGPDGSPGRGGSRLRQGAERRAGSAIGAPGEASPGCRFPGKGEPPAPSASERFSPQRRSKGGAGFPEQWYTVQGRWLIK